jgi:hypothetical protein
MLMMIPERSQGYDKSNVLPTAELSPPPIPANIRVYCAKDPASPAHLLATAQTPPANQNPSAGPRLLVTKVAS